jgi:hypothetical protein
MDVLEPIPAPVPEYVTEITLVFLDGLKVVVKAAEDFYNDIKIDAAKAMNQKATVFKMIDLDGAVQLVNFAAIRAVIVNRVKAPPPKAA